MMRYSNNLLQHPNRKCSCSVPIYPRVSQLSSHSANSCTCNGVSHLYEAIDCQQYRTLFNNTINLLELAFDYRSSPKPPWHLILCLLRKSSPPVDPTLTTKPCHKITHIIKSIILMTCFSFSATDFFLCIAVLDS